MAVNPAPTLAVEHELMVRSTEYFGVPQGVAPLIAGMDEVGRGALAGPVTVGVAVVGPATGQVPARLRDSKLLTPAVRLAVIPELTTWVRSWRTGSATPAEIDALGIIGALRLAGHRALAALPDTDRPHVVILDGAHDWLTHTSQEVFTTVEGTEPRESVIPYPVWHGPVRTVVKGDMRCASVAAASVVAKVDRDQVMVQLHQHFPDYGWESNKGYGSTVHRVALAEHGATVHHRRSWNLGV